MFDTIIAGYRWFFLQLADFIGIGWGIVALSFITSAAMMPLMKAVAGIVKRETEYQGVILPQLAEIKAKYETDVERHLHIQRLYARYAYSPLSAVKKVLPLFVQIPFLLLTYYMLKGTAEINAVSFLFLQDLGKPDALLAAFAVNVLPLVMTAVNILTVYATPGFTTKDQCQAVGISLMFLALLYTAPSALLLYWTLNNAITCVRTLVSKHCEGARLLVSRIGAARRLPAFIREKASDENLSMIVLILLLVALYMRLMVYMKVWFFNCFASYWLMNEVLAVAFLVSAVVRRRESFVVRLFAYMAAALSSLVAAFVLLSLVAIPFTHKLMMLVNQYCDLAIIFDWLFMLGILPVVLSALADFRSLRMAVVKGFLESWHWTLAIGILSIHYSYASHNFKLPLDSVVVLTAYLIVPAVLFSMLCLIVGYRYNRSGMLFKMGLGVAIGAYLIPMISIEQGKILGYSSNLVLRFVLMGVVVSLVLYLKERKTAFVFLSLFGIAVVFNSIRTTWQLSAETNARVEATSGSEAQESLLNAPSARTNSIYFLVYDGYAPDIVLEGMKIKSIGMRQYLGKRGFISYDAYSVGSDTVPSMGNTFNIGGVVQGSYRSAMAGNNVFCDYLRRHGYTSGYVLCAYDMPMRGERMPGDFYFPTAQKVTRPEMVLYPCIIRGILSQSANTFNSYTRDEWLAAKRGLIRTAPAKGRFIYAHSEMPGHVALNPAYRKSPEFERSRYERRVALADKEMQEDIDMLLSKNDDSIIIVASDHGSHLSLPPHENEYDAFTMLDRVGVQLHVRWPHDYKPCLTLNCLQNLFLEIEIYLSGDVSLARFAVAGRTLRIMYPLRAPEGAIVDGIIQTGLDKGKSLFDAARERMLH